MGLCLISSKEISEYRRRWNAMLVDLRNPKAYRQWHIPEAQNVPLEELELFMEQVPKSRLVIFYCQYGNTSIQGRMPVCKTWIPDLFSRRRYRCVSCV